MQDGLVLIKGGNLIDPVNNIEGPYDLLIRNGRIAEISSFGFDTAAIQGDVHVIDAYDLNVAPGFVDVHSHFRDPGFTQKEDMHTGALAAAAGGYTSVVLMANTSPAVDSVELYREACLKAAAEKINIYQSAAVTKERAGKENVDMEALAAAGVKGFTDDGSPLLDEEIVAAAMKRAAALGVPLSFHEEEPSYISTAGINEGEVSGKLGIKGADRRSEITMVKRDLELALETGCKIDIQHVSAKESIELIREAKKRDDRGLIHAEATPNHFSLTEDAVLRYGTNAKINPPLRSEEDRRAIVEALTDGTIDIIATDHAPHTAKDKAEGGWFSCEGDYLSGKDAGQVESGRFGKAPSGILGLETAFSLAVKHLTAPGNLSLSEFIKRISVNPARLYGLDAGTLSVGAPADIVIFSDKLETEYSAFKSKSSNSPYFGAVLPGRIIYTICGGKIVYENAGKALKTLKF
ncbi:MAG: dihydroorotase [Lachnospiraceae bacterium]|nr:dihydroorotase [Lachnospiraceae bacterium]